uniref:Putative secreted protein n=1 Tax=Anopheles darlingi TaxID=43151 RepID=A0A2M4DBR9_ANODA
MVVGLNERNVLSVGLLFVFLAIVSAVLRRLLRGHQGHRVLCGTPDITLFQPHNTPTAIVVIVCGGPRDQRCGDRIL